MLAQLGFKNTEEGELVAPNVPTEMEEDLRIMERGLRVFLRSSESNSDFLRMRLGVKASRFFDKIVPDLLRAGVLVEVPYRGAGAQKRYRMAARMHKVQEALARCGGNYADFIRFVGV